MPLGRARDATPILDCIEVANSANGSTSDSENSIDPTDAIDSLDSAFAARARFRLSPDKRAVSKSSRSSQPASVSSRGLGDNAATMPSADVVKNSQSGKRRRHKSTSSPTSEGPPKKQKNIQPSQNKAAQNDIFKAASTSPVSDSTGFSFMGRTSKPSPQKATSGTVKASVKPDPQPIRSDILGSNETYQSGPKKRAKQVAFFDLTGDTSDEAPEEHEPSSVLRKQVTELTSERNDYRKSLHDANDKISKLERYNLLRKASEQVESERRETAAAASERELQIAKEKNIQLTKAKLELDEQLQVKEADVVRLQQSLDQQVAECKSISSEKSDLEERVKTEEARLQETLGKQLEERELHKKMVKNLQKEVSKKTTDVRRVEQRLTEQTAMCKQLRNDKADLTRQIEAKQLQISNLQEDLDKKNQQHEAEVERFESSERQQNTRLEAEVARTRALAQNKTDLEKQTQDYESTIARLQMEMEKVKNDLEDQKEAADWYKAKFLKFKGWFYTLEKESQEKDAIARRILPKICGAAGVVLDHSKPMEESNVVTEGVRANDPSPSNRPGG